MRELTSQELDQVSGAADVSTIAAGVSLFGLGLGIAVAASLAIVPVGVILGAGTLGEVLVAGSAVSLSGAGGFLIGSGLCY